MTSVLLVFFPSPTLVSLYDTSLNTSRSRSLSLFLSLANQPITLPRPFNLLSCSTPLASSLRRWLPGDSSLMLSSIVSSIPIIAQRSTEDAGLFLTYLVCSGWAKGLKTSVIAFDIAQFFPSLNHSMLTTILRHSGFANCLVDFFLDYFVGKSTQYAWNSCFSHACNADVSVGQGSALFPILSVLYIAPLLYLFECRA